MGVGLIPLIKLSCMDQSEETHVGQHLLVRKGLKFSQLAAARRAARDGPDRGGGQPGRDDATGGLAADVASWRR